MGTEKFSIWHTVAPARGKIDPSRGSQADLGAIASTGGGPASGARRITSGLQVATRFDKTRREITLGSTLASISLIRRPGR
jgi:hypothetical protein